MTGSLLSDVYAAFTRLDWSNLPAAHREAQSIFESVLSPQAFMQDLLSGESHEAIAHRSVEKTTHFKWFVAEGPDSQFSLWLHTYKPREQRRPGHAMVAHNHRFWFTSLILRGSFAVTNHVVESQGYLGDVTLSAVRRLQMTAGDTFVVSPDEIHSLTDIQDDTVSLLVQSSPVRGYSDVYEDGRVTRYLDLESQFAAFAAAGAWDSRFADARRGY